MTNFTKHRVTRQNNKIPKYHCVRLSPNGKHIKQLCDPTDHVVDGVTITDTDDPMYRRGRNTGAVRHAVEMMWNDMKRAHYLDTATRNMVVQLQMRSNHVGVRFRITLMFELTSLGGVISSYDMETRIEDEGSKDQMYLFCNIALGMTAFFCALEGIELLQSGAREYFSDMWNVMDWLNFSIFILVYINIRALTVQEDDFEHRKICEVCQSVGYKDDWQVMGTIRNIKLFLSLCVCIQLLKIIKFTNVLIPKMGLMTAVLSKGLMDLLFFGLVFGISMFAFAMMFYVQLGPVMEDFNDQPASFISLARALFGDFDVPEILNNSHVEGARAERGKEHMVHISLNSNGLSQIKAASEKMQKGRSRLAIIYDERIISAPVVAEELWTPVTLEGFNSFEHAESLATSLNKPLSSNLLIESLIPLAPQAK